jgi:hypothetical protein
LDSNLKSQLLPEIKLAQHSTKIQVLHLNDEFCLFVEQSVVVLAMGMTTTTTMTTKVARQKGNNLRRKGTQPSVCPRRRRKSRLVNLENRRSAARMSRSC